MTDESASPIDRVRPSAAPRPAALTGDALFAAQLLRLRDGLDGLDAATGDSVAEHADVSADQMATIKATLDRFLGRNASR